MSACGGYRYCAPHRATIPLVRSRIVSYATEACIVDVNESYFAAVNIVTRPVWAGPNARFVNRASYLRTRRKCIT